MIVLDRDCVKINAVHQGLLSGFIYVDMQRVHALRHRFHCKRPEHGVDHLRPVTHPVKKEGTCTESQLFVMVLNYAVLTMGTYPTEGNCLPLIGYILVETFVAEPTIVSMKMLRTLPA